MSIVFSEKTRRARPALRWPFAPDNTQCRHVAGAAGGVVAGCRAGMDQPTVSAAAGTGAGKTHHHCRAAGLYGRHTLATLRCKPARILVALLAAVIIGIPVGIAMGLSPTVRGILDPLIELLPSGAAAGLSAADGDLVRHR